MKVLHIVLYDRLYPPMNGGMLRCWNIATKLSSYFEVDLLCLQPGIEMTVKEGYNGMPLPVIQYIAPGEKLDRVVNKGFGKLKNSVKYRWYFKTLTSANSLLLDSIPLLQKTKGNAYDIIVFEHLESLALSNVLKKLFPFAKFILDAHNVDHILLKDKRTIQKLAKIKRLEATLYKRCNKVIACSNKDAAIFTKLNQHRIPVVTVPNGVDTNRNPFQLPVLTRGKCNLIFCGSLDYEPNYSGLIWFLRSVWTVLLDRFAFIKLTVVGRGIPDAGLTELIKKVPGINFIGEVQEVIPYYRDSDLAVVPLLHGSGTRLKILEAMSLGVPVISTAMGAEGIHYTKGKDIMIADTSPEFVNRVEDFVNNPRNSICISQNARAFVEKEYSWEVIGKKLYCELTNPGNTGNGTGR